jgi:hypothetical protein
MSPILLKKSPAIFQVAMAKRVVVASVECNSVSVAKTPGIREQKSSNRRVQEPVVLRDFSHDIVISTVDNDRMKDAVKDTIRFQLERITSARKHQLR